MSRLTLCLVPLSFFSILVACGGQVATIPGDDPGASSSSSSSGGSGRGSSSGDIHCTPPSCGPDGRMVGQSSSSCPQDTSCYSVSNACGMTIWCAEQVDQCAAVPSCAPDEQEVVKCPSTAGSDCHSVTVCGSTINCLRICEGPRPICNPGDVEVPSCPTDTYCYSRSVCNFTIYCMPGPDDAGAVPPPINP